MIVMLKQRFAEFKQTMRYLKEDEQGLTATEYAVCGALVAAALVTAFTNLGVAIQGVINGITTAIG